MNNKSKNTATNVCGDKNNNHRDYKNMNNHNDDNSNNKNQ